MNPLAQLERDPSCLQDLSWRIKGPTSLDELKLKLLQRNWQNESPCSKLLIFRSADADEFVLVPRTGRIQLRVNYQLPRSERAARAEELFHEFFTSLPPET